MRDHDPDFMPVVGDTVVLSDEEGCIVPPGEYLVTDVNQDGSFHVNNGRTAVWPGRVTVLVHHHFADKLIGRIVGWSVDYTLDASQVEPDESLNAVRTVWGRVKDGGYDEWGNEIALCETTHGEPTMWVVSRDAIHTSMPESY